MFPIIQEATSGSRRDDGSSGGGVGSQEVPIEGKHRSAESRPSLGLRPLALGVRDDRARVVLTQPCSSTGSPKYRTFLRSYLVRTERHTSYGFTSFTTSVEYVRLSFVAMNKSV